jgi:5-methylcytosine-specific restriction endonuclease McrA
VDRSPVLLLNQNYQPLNVCDVRRAFVLLGHGKAETLEITDAVIRSAYEEHAEPSILRLLYMVKRPLHERRLSRQEVFIRDRHTCQYCGKKKWPPDPGSRGSALTRRRALLDQHR